MKEPREDHHNALATTRFHAVAEHLDALGIAYEVFAHEPTQSASAEATATHYRPEQVAKTIVLQQGGSYVLAVIPASERLDLHKVRKLLGASRSLRLATEEELARDFPSFDVGAVPPVGPMLPLAEVVDRRLVDQRRILCAGGDHEHSFELDPRDLVRVTNADVADACVRQ